MFNNCQMGGVSLAPAEVVLQPPPAPPVVAPNTAMGMMGVGGEPTILIAGMPAHNTNTVIPMTQGAVGLGGAASGTVMGPARPITSSTSVFMGSGLATRMTDTTLQNTSNTVGVRLSPSQTIVMTLG